MYRLLVIMFTIALLITGCKQAVPVTETLKVGLLLPETINDPVWGNKGYKGLLKIQSSLNAEVYYKERMKDKKDVAKAVEEFADQGVTLLFGHGSEYGIMFDQLNEKYPNIHFVYFNGDFFDDNLTSIKFDSYAMGFFGGMVAAKMSEKEKIGVIASFEWQPEVAGFRDGVYFQNPNSKVSVHYTQNWDAKEEALKVLENMLNQSNDVIYPAGDTFNVPVIERVKEEGLYVIGFISDQSDLGETTVLTSTVQHVDDLYEKVAQEYFAHELKSGIRTYDFQDGVITMGKFSSEVPRAFRQQINNYVEQYKETGQMPNN